MCLPPGDCVTLSREMPVTMSRIVAWQRPDVVPSVSWPLLTLRASLGSGLSGSNSRAALPAFSLGHNSRSDTLQPHYIASLILHNSRTGQMGKQSESSIAIMWLNTINEVLVIPRSLNLVLVNLSPKESLFVSVCLYVCDKVFSLRLSGSNLLAISQQQVSRQAVSQLTA